MSIARGVAAAALVLAIVLVAVLLFRGSDVHEYDLVFQNAGQLVKDDDVQVGGRRIGSVREIELTNDNTARVRVEIQEPYAPLREGTTAVIRLTSLSGIANRYIALTPAPNTAKELDDGSTLAVGSTTDVVDLDQLFNALDPEARKDLQGVIKGFATQYDGRGKEAGESAEYFNPFLSTSRRLVGQLTQDEAVLTDFIVNSSRAVTAVAERRDDLASLVGNTNTTAAAIGDENVALAQALGLLPTTLRRANTTFVNLRATLDDLDVLVAESKPATKDLAPFLRELRPLVHAARPTIKDLRKAVTREGANNDLVDATRKMPQLQKVASPTFRNSTQALQKSQPVLEFVRPYTPEITGWFHDFGQATSNYDANGHFARIQPIFNAFTYIGDGNGGQLVPNALNKKFDGLSLGNDMRCPGAASQPTADGSAPFTDGGNLGPDDCDPSQVPSGP
jgi:phospholipid/cholesterol/gamma-HCH transport system substrate-binding protein